MIAVGINEYNLDELMDIAGGDANHVKEVEDFDALAGIAEEVSQTICGVAARSIYGLAAYKECPGVLVKNHCYFVAEPCDVDSNQCGTRYYEYSKQSCLEQNGELASIKTRKAFRAVKKYLTSLDYETYGFWLGGRYNVRGSIVFFYSSLEYHK